jgi:hypothetical protein
VGDFLDDFNRADGDAGNGWTISPDGFGGSIGIVSEALTTSGNHGTVGLYRPVDLTQSVTVSADLTPTSGFAGLRLRYTTAFLFGGDGSVDSGYGVYVYRGDENYNNSAIILFYNGQVIEQTASSFQFGDHVHLEFKLATDGSIMGQVSSELGLFGFQFNGFAPTYSGSNFTIRQELGDPRSAEQAQATVDNLVIDIGSDGVATPLEFQQPFSTDGILFTQARDGDGWTLANNDFDAVTISTLPTHRGHRHFHRGEDWVPDRGKVIGTDVFAVADGEVVYAQYHPFFGNTVVIAHDVSGNGIGVDIVYSLYAHLSTIAVAVGDVGRGEMIGEVGRTGAANAPHLHWEIFSADWSAYLAGALVGYGETASPPGWFDPTDFVSGPAPDPSAALSPSHHLTILTADHFIV